LVFFLWESYTYQICSSGIFWDQEFHAQEIHLASEASNRVQEPTQAQQQQKSTPVIAPDELAKTAGLLLENLKHEQSAKFKNSQFIGLMKQLRDGDVVVDGNTFVGSGERASVDVKGKGRAIEFTPASERLDSAIGVLTPGVDVLSIPQGRTGQRDVHQGAKMGEEDANAAYFRQENEDFIRYWTDRGASEHAPPVSTSDWDKLQDDWDRFEATVTGIKPVEGYRLQKNNPYLSADRSKMTRHHLMHNGHRSTAMEVSVSPLE
jgi:peroxin-5